MQRPIPWLWIALAGFVLLAPGLAGRFFVDVLEGVTLLLVLGPLALAGLGLLAWQLLKRRLITCSNCGTPSFGVAICPGCGAELATSSGPVAGSPTQEMPPGNAVIDVTVTEVTETDRGQQG
jgi:hypothetical protein